MSANNLFQGLLSLLASNKGQLTLCVVDPFHLDGGHEGAISSSDASRSIASFTEAPVGVSPGMPIAQQGKGSATSGRVERERKEDKFTRLLLF